MWNAVPEVIPNEGPNVINQQWEFEKWLWWENIKKTSVSWFLFQCIAADIEEHPYDKSTRHPIQKTMRI